MNHITPEEYQLAYESAYEFAQKEIRPHNAEIERTDEFPSWLWSRLAEQGFLGVAIPEEYGGSDGDFYMAALVKRGVARVNLALSLSFGSHLNLCGHNILRNGTEEQGPYNIQVNAIAPGYMDVGVSELIQNQEAFFAHIMKRTPMRRIGKANELIGAVILLASDASSYITGQTLFIDGGFLA